MIPCQIEKIIHQHDLLSDFRKPEHLYNYGALGIDLAPKDQDFLHAKKQRILKGLQYRELLKIIDLHFSQENILTVLLKGVGLASRYYHEECHRPFSDIDLLVSPEQFEEAEKVLISLGGKKEQNAHKWSGNNFKSVWYFNLGIVELHSSILYQRKIEGMLEKRTRNCSIKELHWIKEFDAELNFVYLCGHHAFQHLFDEFYWLTDLYLILEKENLNWMQVLADAKKLKLERAVSVSCQLIEKIFHSEKKYSTAIKMRKFPVTFYLISLYVTPKHIFTYAHREGSFYYLFLKSLLRNSLWETLTYGLKRLIQRKLRLSL